MQLQVTYGALGVFCCFLFPGVVSPCLGPVHRCHSVRALPSGTGDQARSGINKLFCLFVLYPAVPVLRVQLAAAGMTYWAERLEVQHDASEQLD